MDRRSFFPAVAGLLLSPFIARTCKASPPAISIPFETLPKNLYIKGQRYMVSFDRIILPRVKAEAWKKLATGHEKMVNSKTQ